MNRPLRPCMQPGCPELVPFGRCEEHKKHLSQQRDLNRGTPKERGYDAAWRRFRLKYLAKYPLCMDCLDEIPERTTPAVEVHHEKSILEYPELKFVESNLKGLCEHHHALRGAGFWKSKEMKRLKEVILVSGAPGSGKSTYIKQYMKPGDLIWDFDEVLRALTGQDLYYRPDWGIDACLTIRDSLYDFIESSTKLKKVWIIATAPKSSQRNELRKRFAADIIVMKPNMQVCMDRISQDTRRSDKSRWCDVIRQWFDDYEEDSRDKVMT